MKGSRFLQNVQLAVQMRRCRRQWWTPFMDALSQPGPTQQAVLQTILRAQARTVFGQAHQFSRLTGYVDFRLAVPIQTYEQCRLDVEDQEERHEPRLNADSPHAYVLTNGTTGKPKLIPVVSSTAETLRRYHWLSAYAQYEAFPGIFDGTILVIAGSEVEGYLATGTSYGSMSGLLTAALPAVFRRKLVSPHALEGMGDDQQHYFYLAAHALAAPDLSVVATVNPSTFLKLWAMVCQQFAPLVAWLSSVPASGLAAAVPPPCLSKERLRQLQALVGREDQLSVALLWPRLQVLRTWRGGSARAQIPVLREILPTAGSILERGYLASECVGSVNIDPLANRCVPMIQDYFYEFVRQEDWEADRLHALTLHQLEQGGRYYVLVTTAHGLYRYGLNDLIEVTGWFRGTPTIAVLQRGTGVTSLAGEHLYEYQVEQAMEALQRHYEIRVDFYLMVAEPMTRQYILYVEHPPLDAFAGYHVESAISQVNDTFHAKRQSGCLPPIRLISLEPGAGEAYRIRCLQTGQRDSQLQIARLQYAKDCLCDLMKYARP